MSFRRLPWEIVFLRVRYKVLSGYITKCYENGDMEKLYDFLLHLQTEDEPWYEM